MYLYEAGTSLPVGRCWRRGVRKRTAFPGSASHSWVAGPTAERVSSERAVVAAAAVSFAVAASVAAVWL